MTTETTTNRPTHGAYVIEGKGDDAYWTKIGAAWPHKDGDGYNVKLFAYPTTGELTIRRIKPKTEQKGRQ